MQLGNWPFHVDTFHGREEDTVPGSAVSGPIYHSPDKCAVVVRTTLHVCLGNLRKLGK